MRSADKVWRLQEPLVREQHFGGPLILPPWERVVCSVCDRGVRAERVEGQRMLWERGTPVVLGDVLWNQGRTSSDAFVSPQLARAIGGLPGVDFEDLEVDPVFRDPESGRPGKPLSLDFVRRLQSYRRLVVGAEVPVDVTESTIQRSSDPPPCATCGRLTLRWRDPNPSPPPYAAAEPDYVVGVEWVERPIIAKFGDPIEIVHHPRRPHHGAVFHRSDVGELALWTVAQDGSPSVLCDDRLREVLLDTGATNVEILEVGTIVG